jgi:PAS domain S-box-containing protein
MACTNSIVIAFLAEDGTLQYSSPSIKSILGYESEHWVGKPAIALVHPDDQPILNYQFSDVLANPKFDLPIEVRLRHADGTWREFEIVINNCLAEPTLKGLVATCQDITERKRSEEWLKHYQLLSASTNDIMLFVHRDGRILEANDAAVIAYGYDRAHLLSLKVQDLRSREACAQVTKQISQGSMGGLLFETVHRRQDGTLFPVEVSSKGAAMNGEKILLNVIRDITVRKEAEEELRSLYKQLQTLNTSLEKKVRHRTAQLRRSLEFEARLKRITDKVRDSLDEDQIIQTAVCELAFGLETCSADIGIYNLERGTSFICNEYIQHGMPSADGKTVKFQDYSDIYTHLLMGKSLQFCWLSQVQDECRPNLQRLTVYACPLIDDQGVLGDLWLYKPEDTYLDDTEMRLVQQVANQCAIAIRQARLYQAAQNQVQELERLNRLKDDFLNTVSHELRTPMSNIKMATQMLEVALNQPPESVALSNCPYTMPDLRLKTSDPEVARYFQILHDECHREIELINNLLDLSRLDSGTEPLVLSSIDPHYWIPSIAEPFIARTDAHQQTLIVHVPQNLPTLNTDLSLLSRILTELLGNACKYTPAGEKIIVTAQAIADPNSKLNIQTPDAALANLSASCFLSPVPCFLPSASCSLPSILQISITNTGIEIPFTERDRIFDKFYRIPSNDPWKHEGTGLGLALVRKMVEHIGATIHVESAPNETTFHIYLPTITKSACP